MDQLSNLAVGTVATAPSPAVSGTSLTLTSGQGARFPSSGSFDVLLRPSDAAATDLPTVAELARASRSGDVLTLVRGQGGTTARSVAVGWVVEQVVTAALLGQLDAAAVAAAAAAATAQATADGAVSGLAGKAAASHTHSAADVTSGTLPLARGGTGGTDAATARTGLGLGGAAVLPVGTSAGTVAAGDDARIAGAAQRAADLSDLASASTARTNLGLGSAATQPSSAFLGATAQAVDSAKVAGVTVTGTAAPGQTIIASSSTAATWQTPSGGGVGFPVTASVFTGTFNTEPTHSANRAMFMANVGSAQTITRLALHIVTTSGSIDAGVYVRSGNVGESLPGARSSSLGGLPCPAVGYAELTIAAATIAAGDWFALAFDNATAKAAVGAAAGGVTNFFKGLQCYQTAAYPLPATASVTSVGANNNDSFVMKGLP